MEPRLHPFRILALDGGGIRGVFQAVLLQRIAQEVPAFLPSVRLFAGTSIGSITALSLAMGRGPGEIVEFFRAHGRRVFDDTWYDDIRDVGRLLGADYDMSALRQVLVSTYGDQTLEGLQRRVLVPAFDLDNEGTPRTWKMKFFHNFPGDDSDGAERLVDVALRSSAAPSYFPAYQGYIDGGIGCNSPSMAAVCAAINPDVGRQDVRSVRVLSISTGQSPEYLSGEKHDWGYAQWARPMVGMMIHANMGIADYQCQQILGSAAYCRLDPLLPRRVPTDDVRSLDDLVSWANQVDIEETVAWLEEHYI